jgi:GntR family transcriptional regulator
VSSHDLVIRTLTSMLSVLIMARYDIDPLAPEPSYVQLAAILRGQIESGDIQPRQPLPSITYLVGETGLAVGTVRRAIKVLADEGLVMTVPGRGTYATAR